MNIYDVRRFGVVVFLVVSLGLVAFFLYVSNNLVSDLAAQERERMQIWADATKQIADIGQSDASQGADIDFLFSIIERNHTIPVLLTDDEGNILLHRNFDLPDAIDSLAPYYISPANEAFLNAKLDNLRKRANVIHIIITPDNLQHLYYDDSKLLRRLSYYPYIQLFVMLAFILVVYFAVNSTRRAEQNKVWVGLSKETAHQLGTPISSLMAWMELLQSMGVDPDTVREMNKDVNRLSTIASRFSKIGSRPKMALVHPKPREALQGIRGTVRHRFRGLPHRTRRIVAQKLYQRLPDPLGRLGRRTGTRPDRQSRGRRRRARLPGTSRRPEFHPSPARRRQGRTLHAHRSRLHAGSRR